MKWFETINSHYNLIIVMIEDVHSIFGASAKSNFNFGRNVGIVNVLPLAAGNRVDLVQPKKWQKFVGVKAKGKLIKNNVAEICERLYPQVNIRGARGGLLDGLSDSLMIAYYASQHHKIN